MKFKYAVHVGMRGVMPKPHFLILGEEDPNDPGFLLHSTTSDIRQATLFDDAAEAASVATQVTEDHGPFFTVVPLVRVVAWEPVNGDPLRTR